MTLISFTPFPDLQTERLVLRQITTGDAEALYNMRSDEQVMKYIDRPLAKTIGDAKDMIYKINEGVILNTAITWGIFLKDNPSLLIGTIGYWQILIEHFRAEIGYMLSPPLQGKGIMQEALTAVLHFGFHDMKLHSVEAQVNPDHQASIKLLKRNGFVKEAFFKENFYFNGRFLDTAVYSLVVDGHYSERPAG